MSKTLKVIGSLFIVITLLLSMSVTAFAESIDTTRTGSITILFDEDQYEYFVGTGVTIYQVAYAIVDGSEITYVLTNDFENSEIVLSDIDNDTVKETVAYLSDYISDNNITGDTKVVLDDGTVTFDSLKFGVYLVTQGSIQTTADGFQGEFNSFLAYIPQTSTDGSWKYDIEVYPKSGIVYTPVSVDVIHIIKEWHGDNEDTRPDSVNIDVYKNGELYDTVTLNEENDWFVDLTDDTICEDINIVSVVEQDIPSDYTPTYTSSEGSFFITNTYTGPKTPVTPSNPSNPTTPENPDTPENTTTPNTPVRYDLLNDADADGTPSFQKVDQDGEILPDAVFVLSRTVDGTEQYAVVNESGYLSSWSTSSSDASELITDEEGKINVDGLDAGTYTLTETRAPDGYNTLTSSITVTIASGGTVTYSFEGEESTTIKVVNDTGTELPSVPTLYTVTYTDGIEDETIFVDQVFTVVSGSKTPTFDGTPTRNDYVFVGWTPEIEESVTESIIYTAQWQPILTTQFNPMWSFLMPVALA